MKNLHFFTFERNQYYYGKMMTYQDMTAEQKYLNDKRRLINRFLHGSGVAAGLQVVSLDDRTVSVEAGVALDGAGREIVLDEPRVMMLDQIEGYENLTSQEDISYAYLCLAYSEEGICPAKGPVEDGSESGKIYEKFREDGRLYLTPVSLTDDRDTLESLTWQTAVLFENSDLMVSCRIPAFVGSGESFDVIMRIEAKHPLQDVSVDLDASLSALNIEGKELLQEHWSGSFRTACEAAETRHTLTAFSIEDGYGSITIKRRQLEVEISGRKYYPADDLSARVLISNKDVYHQMVDSWYSNAMNQVLRSSGTGGIYLARLYLKSCGDELRIQQIEQLPFGQRTYNAFVNMGLTDQLIRDVDALKAEHLRQKADREQKNVDRNVPRVASGVVTIPMGIGGREGARYFSNEVVHGLGLGRIRVDLSIDTEEAQYFGSGEIFEDMKVRAEMGVKANCERGSFVIGVRLLESTSAENVKIRWFAEKLPETKENSNEQHIRIIPDKPELRCMQSRYFRTETENLSGATILWEVCTPEGGTITRDGMYTAPDTEGIYEIRAFCQENPKVCSSVFVIVRE